MVERVEESFKYVVRGTVGVTVWEGDFQEELGRYATAAYYAEIKELLEEYGEGVDLANYIWEDSPLRGLIDSIIVGLELENEGGKLVLYSKTEVISKVELDDKLKDVLLEYIVCQFSEGFGSGLSGEAFAESVSLEYKESLDWGFDLDDGGENYELVEVHSWHYFTLWQREGFELYYI